MVVRSMALYGAPIWVDALSAENQILLRRPQRIMAIRAIRGYRTISSDAACALAGTPPWDLEAKALATIYRRISESRARDQEPMLEEVKRWRTNARVVVLRKWGERLRNPCAGHWTAGAIQPVLKEW
ncbi:uncharacterized protein LOC134802627, partial [Cydia splendana]|uniref:uncharacterized protein LOC134802627 n=1 Tax=Cydia splendana TaxID=1100963 RepID=UPI00300CC7F2